MDRKPRLFIGSSVESLEIADAVNTNLDHQAEVTIWRNGTFELSSNTIDSLTKKAGSVDFSLFIFSPDDISLIRGQKKPAVRDNVLFELGLFIGSLGKERCFILKPRNVDLHFPTDLLGLTLADFETNRSDGDLVSAVNYACSLIKKQMSELGNIQNVSAPPAPAKSAINIKGELKDYDYVVLSDLLSTATASPDGKAINVIKSNLSNNSNQVDLSIVRLERFGYVQKRNDEDYNGYEFYSYSITEEGLELLLENENKTFPSIPDPFDDDDNPYK